MNTIRGAPHTHTHRYTNIHTPTHTRSNIHTYRYALNRNRTLSKTNSKTRQLLDSIFFGWDGCMDGLLMKNVGDDGG